MHLKKKKQHIKFHTNLVIICKRVVDCCYHVMYFLKEITNTKQIHANPEPQLRF